MGAAHYAMSAEEYADALALVDEIKRIVPGAALVEIRPAPKEGEVK